VFEILSQRIPLESVPEENPLEIRMFGKIDTEEVVYFPLLKIRTTPQAHD
jgi:hypothetical protein